MKSTSKNSNQYQSKKEAKLVHQEAGKRQQKRSQIYGIFQTYTTVGLIIVGLIAGWYALNDLTGPQSEDLSRSISVMADTSHIPVSQSQAVSYNSDPPTSGPHYDQTARSGFRTEEIPDGNLIHNLEHGDIWISYHPEISDKIKDQLRQFAAAKVIITPRSANGTDIALAAWGRLDEFKVENESIPTERIEDFIERYTGRGPERIPGASGGI